MKKFWNFKAADKRAELQLYGDISDASWWGDEITPKQFKADLDALGDISELDIYINSGGGDVFAGFAIYNMLKRHAATKTVYVDGLAASIASVIAMVGDKIVMPENAMMMIHNAWTIAIGNKAEIRKIADEMERIDGQIEQIYADRTGNDDIASLMEAETWMTGAEAVEKGFADELEPNKKIAASLGGGSLLVFNSLTGAIDSYDLKRYRKEPPAEHRGGLGVSAVIADGQTQEYHVRFEDEPESNDVLPPHGGFFTPDNGGESQPVADNSGAGTSGALADQRKHFSNIRRKIMGG